MPNSISGLAIPFNVIDGNDRLWERVSPMALDRTLAEGGWRGTVLAQAFHDESKPIGHSKANLRLWKEPDGLHFRVDNLDGSAEQISAYENVSRGIVRGVSLGFFVVDDEFNKEGGRVVRTLLDLDLIEVSIVTRPFYQTTFVQPAGTARSAAKQLMDQRRYQLRKAELALRMRDWPALN